MVRWSQPAPHAQAVARPDLRLVVMSATLGGGLAERVSSLMAKAMGLEEEGAASAAAAAAAETVMPAVPVVTSEGRSYPVRVVYLGECVGSSGHAGVGLDSVQQGMA